MSDINTPEPPSHAEDQIIASSSAAEQSTDSKVEAQPSSPNSAPAEQPHTLEEASVAAAEAEKSKEVEPQRIASAAPEEKVGADTGTTPEAATFMIQPEHAATALIQVKEEGLTQNDTLGSVPVHASMLPKKEETQAEAGQSGAEQAEAQEDISMREPTSITEDAALHEEANQASTTSAAHPAATASHDELPEQPAPLSTALESEEAALRIPPPSGRASSSAAPFSASLEAAASTSSVATANTSAMKTPGIMTSVPAPGPAGGSASIARRPSPGRVSLESQEKARQEEALRLQRDNEEMRLRWLSLPANDHLTYYSDTDDDASANESNDLPAKGANGRMPLLSRTKLVYGNGKRKREDWLKEERESSDSEDEDLEGQEQSEERQYRTGNRGNKLLKGSRWNRRGKLGLWTEAKNEKEMHDRFMSRVKAIQRAGVESLLHNAPGPKAIQADGPIERDILEGSDRLLYRDLKSTNVIEENLQSTSLAPALLRPILTARALLESHTLRHTFRNPHIGALSKTALDLRESEGHLSRALGRCFSAMESMSSFVEDAQTGEVRVNGSQNTDHEMDPKAIGAEGTAGTADEVNPALFQLDDLFVTKTGLPIPVASSEGEEQVQQSTELQAVLTTNQQRDVIRAALECLQDLGLDSLEYVERLDEVRGRLEGVKRRRTQVWQALRLWALKRDGGEDEDDNEGEIEEEEIATARPATKTAVAANASAPNRRKR